MRDAWFIAKDLLDIRKNGWLEAYLSGCLVIVQRSAFNEICEAMRKNHVASNVETTMLDVGKGNSLKQWRFLELPQCDLPRLLHCDIRERSAEKT